jgi:Amt family ammonium transporter
MDVPFARHSDCEPVLSYSPTLFVIVKEDSPMRQPIASMAAIALLALSFSPAWAADAASPAVADKQAETPKDEAKPAPTLDRGDTAWMLASTGLVLLMVPGLALFYGGMVRRKNILGTMMHSMVALAIIGIQWVLFGYALAFGDSHGGWIGWSPDFLGLQNILTKVNGVEAHRLFPGTSIPIIVHCMYQGMFAIITPALISGAIAERVRFGPYCLFIFLWAVLVYDPLAHWVWAIDSEGNPAGWLGKLGAIDFAGGTVVHIAAGLSGLAAILVLRKRIGYPEHAMHPNSMVLTLTGAGILWFGWFGFNGGSALGASGLAGAALGASQVAAAAAALSWMLVEWIHKGKPTALGLASGIVAGLVAITPASGYVTPMGALAIGLIAGVVCYFAVCLKPICKYDDSLDAFGVHGVGGFLGAVLTGVFASAVYFKAGSGTDLPNTSVGIQLIAALSAVVYSFAVTLILVKGIDVLWGFCLDPRAENEGLDRSEHGEVGFDLGPALDVVAERAPQEPRHADVPPNGYKRFTVVVDGPTNEALAKTWSELCQAGAKPPTPEFRAVYPYLTTMKGNRFNFRGGDAATLSGNLQQLLQERLSGASVKARVEA